MNESQITKVFTAFYPSYAALQIPVGILLQVFSAEIAIIFPVILSGICAELVSICNSYESLVIIRFLMGLSQTTCFLATLAIIQQYFSLDHVSLYTGIALMVGNLSPLALLCAPTVDNWRRPHFILGCIMQFICVMLFIAFAIDRKRLIRNSLQPQFHADEIAAKSGEESRWTLWFVSRDKLSVPDPVNKPSESLNLGKISVECKTPMGTPFGTPKGDKVSIDGPKRDIIQTGNVNVGDAQLTFCQKLLAALSNKFTYLFAFVYCCQVIPHTVLVGIWLQKYLSMKFRALLEGDLDYRQNAQMITLLTYIGASFGSFLFGYLAKKYRATNKYINRQIILLGFILNSIIFIVIYIPYQYHTWSNGYHLALCTFLHGMSLGTIPVIFAGTRQVNDRTKSADVASGLVSSICIGAVSGFGIVFSEIIKYVRTDQIRKELLEHEYELYNHAFLIIVVMVVIGFVAALFIPANNDTDLLEFSLQRQQVLSVPSKAIQQPTNV